MNEEEEAEAKRRLKLYKGAKSLILMRLKLLQKTFAHFAILLELRSECGVCAN